MVFCYLFIPAVHVISQQCHLDKGTGVILDERRQLHPPNKKKYEERLEVLTAAISSKEAELVSFSDSLHTYCFCKGVYNLDVCVLAS